MIDLFDRHLQQHAATFARRFHESPILSTLYKIRVALLQDSMWLPSSPLHVQDFSPWKSTNTFKFDLLIRTLHFCSSLGLRFSHSLPASAASMVNLPIHEYFSSCPGLFAKSIEYLRKHNIRSFAQCVNGDGTSLLSFDSIIRRTSLFNAPRTPNWYKFLASLVCILPNTLRLKSQYRVPESALLPTAFQVVPLLLRSQAYSKLWLACQPDNEPNNLALVANGYLY